MDLPEGAQAAFLERTCGGDRALKAAVLKLLQAERLPDLLSSRTAIELEASQTAADSGNDGGLRSFGPYRSVECIGRGGMGVVYKAVRGDDYCKTVAVKVLPGGFESTDLIERFRRERQILARLEHPNIARLLDGGATSDGLPYLVMEYVEGLPLDRYAEERRFSGGQRLRLFLQVCEAVQYAHRALVVHCDLKPSNILVGVDGIPRLLDFGIAKLQDHALAQRKATLPLLTPGFASPEQITGEPVTTASDIYSLGVLLYVLLTQRTPYGNAAGPRDMARAVCEQELDLASCRNIDRDLRTIIAMATRKEASRRYTTVEQLGEDIQAFLEKRPVRARRDTPAYRASRFIRRNRFPVAAAVLALAAIAAGFGSSWSESRRAQRRFNDLRGLAHFLMFDAYGQMEQLTGTTALRRSVVAQAQVYLDRLARDGGNDPTLAMELAESYSRLGKAQGLPYGPNLGDTTGALASFGKAQEILERLARMKPGDGLIQNRLCGNYQQIATILERAGRLSEAQDAIHRAVAIAAKAHREHPENPNGRLQLGSVLVASGYADELRAEEQRSPATFQEALRSYQASLDELLPLAPSSDEALACTAVCYFNISYVHWHLGDLGGGRAEFGAALDAQLRGAAINRGLAEKYPESPEYRRLLADNLDEIGYTLTRLGRFREAVHSFRESLARFEAIAAADPRNVEAQKDIADVCRYFAGSLAQSGRRIEALPLARRAAGIYDRIAGSDPSNVEVRKARAEIGELRRRTAPVAPKVAVSN